LVEYGIIIRAYLLQLIGIRIIKAMVKRNLENDSDFLEFIEEVSPADKQDALIPWNILVVDDDTQVHETTTIALRNAIILDRPLKLTHAYSAQEAERILGETTDFAVVLLDVVMESDAAGLCLIHAIRDRLGLTDVRLILRTGQPGYAPELEVIRDYDINDYRTKSELSSTRLITSLTAALRSYDQICSLNYSRAGLEKMVKASADLFENRGIKEFAEGVLTQISGLIGAVPGGIVCAKRGFPGDNHDPDGLYIIGAMGHFARAINQPLSALGAPAIEADIKQVMAERCSLFNTERNVLYLQSGGQEEAVYIATGRPVRAVDQRLLEVFGTNISAGFANVYLFQQLNFLAFHDSLTGLPNRQGLLELYDQLQAEQPKERTVTLLDIDHFSEINDALGMSFGNEVLLAVTRRLRDELPDSAHVGRFGGDVIAVIAESDKVSIDFIINLFVSHFDITGYSLPVRVTAGSASSRDGSKYDNGAQIFQYAGMALSRAKRGHRGGFERFVENLAVESRQRLNMTSALKQAVSAKQLVLYYQPKIDLQSGKVVGAEALARWMGEQGDLIPPNIFIPLAEQSGLIIEIGEWVINEAIGQMKRWANTPLGDLHIAINVSAEQILAGTVIGPVRAAIEQHQIPATQLEIEITESVVIEDFDKVTNCIQVLHDMGIGVALDDFGTGFSSLSYLQRLAINTLKIDRAFIRNIGTPGQTEERIAEMIVALGKLLNLTTVAEGIETKEQEALAKQWGCRIGQGFLYAAPMSPDKFEQWVVNRH